MRDDLGVGLGHKLMVSLTQLFFELQVILDDAVVNYDNAPGAIAVWMSIFFSRTAVSGPARVSNSVGSVERAEPDYLFEVAKLSLSAANFEQVAFVDHRDPGRVVTAILELPQTVNDQRHNLLVSNVANNSAHKLPLVKSEK